MGTFESTAPAAAAGNTPPVRVSTRSRFCPRRSQADLILVLVSLLWGVMFVIAKEALDDVSAVLYLTLRFTVAAVALAILFGARLRGGFSGKETCTGILLGAVLMIGYLLQTIGLAYTTPAKSAFLTGSYVIAVPFFGWLVYRIRPRLPEVLGVSLTGLGIALLSTQGETIRIGRGEVLTIGCAIAFAAHIVMLGKVAPKFHFANLSFLQLSAAAVFAAIALPLLETPVLRWRPMVVMAIFAGGLLATALAFVVQTWAQQFTTPTRAALIFSLEPVFAVLAAWLWRGELLTGYSACGAALILGGVLLVELKPAGDCQHPSS